MTSLNKDTVKLTLIHVTDVLELCSPGGLGQCETHRTYLLICRSPSRIPSLHPHIFCTTLLNMYIMHLSIVTHLVLYFLLVLVIQRIFLLIWVSSNLNTHKWHAHTDTLKHYKRSFIFRDPEVSC